MNKTILITWEIHRRTRSIGRELGLPLFELVTPKRGLRRYFTLGIWTISVLVRHRPTTLVLQNPSIVLAWLGIVYRLLVPTTQLIVDAHNVAIEQTESKNRVLRFLATLAVTRADRTVVTNGALAEVVRKLGGSPIVLPDPLPVPPAICAGRAPTSRRTVTVIATFADDEPIGEIINAARILEGKYEFQFTGRSDRWRARHPVTVPRNVRFLGFLPDHDYWTTLADSRVMIDMTTRDACLVCGAYECVSLGRPVVLSDTVVNRELFGDLATYAKVSANDIADAVARADMRFDQLERSVDVTRVDFMRQWHVSAGEVIASVSGGSREIREPG